jgi:hypothetical protein
MKKRIWPSEPKALFLKSSDYVPHPGFDPLCSETLHFCPLTLSFIIEDDHDYREGQKNPKTAACCSEALALPAKKEKFGIRRPSVGSLLKGCGPAIPSIVDYLVIIPVLL